MPRKKDNHTFVVLDTSFLLHYQSFNQIDWCTEINAKKVTLIISRHVLTELNEQKDNGIQKVIKERAKKVISLIDSTRKSNYLVNTAVDLQVLIQSTDSTLKQYNLGDTTDDRIIAHALTVKEINSNNKVMVATNDIAFSITADIVGLEKLEITPTYRLPDIEDELSKKLRESHQEIAKLNKEIHKYQIATPNLQLTFSDNSSVLSFQVEKIISYPINLLGMSFNLFGLPLLLNPLEKTKQVSRTKKNRELKKIATNSTSKDINEIGRQLAEITPLELHRWQKEMKIYENQMKIYEKELDSYNLIQSLTFDFSTLLSNSGQKPANQVRLILQCPSNIRFLSHSELPQPPVAPMPPDPPKSNVEVVASLISLLYKKLTSGSSLQISHPIALYSGEEKLIFHKISEQKLTIEITKLPHYAKISLPAIYLQFSDHTAVRPFELRYMVISDEMPTPKQDILNINAEVKLINLINNLSG